MDPSVDGYVEKCNSYSEYPECKINRSIDKHILVPSNAHKSLRREDFKTSLLRHARYS